MKAAGLFGRLVPNTLADYFEPLNMTFPSVVISAIKVLFWLSVRSVAQVLVIAIIYGFFWCAAITINCYNDG
jgi:nitrate/nitrite transporter NarK